MPMKTNKISPNPRSWGPCENSEASDLVEDVLNDHQTTEIFRRFAIGEIGINEMSYMIQGLFEAAEEMREEQGREELRGGSHRSESA